MPLRAILFLASIGAATTLPGQSPTPTWRTALAAEYSYEPSLPEPTDESSPLRPGVPIPTFEDDDPDIVSLPEMRIAGRRVHRDLDKGIAENTRRIEASKLTWKGGPLYTKDIGPVRFGVYSVLYIPVLVGFSW